MEYKITLERSLKVSWGIWSALLIPFAIIVILTLRYGFENNYFYWFIFFECALLPIAILCIIPHLNYLLLNKNDRLKFDFKTNAWTFQASNSIVNFQKSEIDKIICYTKHWKLHGQFFLMPWDDYSHCIITLRNGKSFILSSLMCDLDVIQGMSETIEFRPSFYRTGFGLKHHI